MSCVSVHSHLAHWADDAIVHRRGHHRDSHPHVHLELPATAPGGERPAGAPSDTHGGSQGGGLRRSQRAAGEVRRSERGQELGAHPDHHFSVRGASRVGGSAPAGGRWRSRRVWRSRRWSGRIFPRAAVDVVVSTVAGAAGRRRGWTVRRKGAVAAAAASELETVVSGVAHSFTHSPFLQATASRSSSTSSSCRCSRKSRPGSCRTSA